MLQSMGLQRVGHDLVTELKRRELTGWLDTSSRPAQVGNSLVI